MQSKFLIASAMAGLMLATAAPALAHEDTSAQADISGSASVQGNDGFDVGQFIGAHLGLDARAGVSEDGDGNNDGHATSTTAVHAHAMGGVITSINGTTFTIDPFGPKSTTTVTTDGSTVFKTKGSATTSAALSVGDRVVVMGTTTATSTTGDTVAASIVRLISEGWGHFKFWLGFR